MLLGRVHDPSPAPEGLHQLRAVLANVPSQGVEGLHEASQEALRRRRTQVRHADEVHLLHLAEENLVALADMAVHQVAPRQDAPSEWAMMKTLVAWPP